MMTNGLSMPMITSFFSDFRIVCIVPSEKN
jgi:hypothetical protein